MTCLYLIIGWLALGLASGLVVWLLGDRIVADEPVEVEDYEPVR